MNDHPITTESEAELLAPWAKLHDWPSRSIGQLPIYWGSDNDTAVAMAHDRFRWFDGGWAVNTDPSTLAGFEGASQQRFLDKTAGAPLEKVRSSLSRTGDTVGWVRFRPARPRRHHGPDDSDPVHDSRRDHCVRRRRFPHRADLHGEVFLARLSWRP